MLDEFIFKYRWFLGIGLTVLIIGGASLIWWDKNRGEKKVSENRTIAELQKQNEMLRQELSQGSKAVAGAADEQDKSDLTNINTASAEELDALPNIGPARAADIIAYREQNGSFKSIEEIKNIKGIGDKSFEELKDLITVGTE